MDASKNKRSAGGLSSTTKMSLLVLLPLIFAAIVSSGFELRSIKPAVVETQPELTFVDVTLRNHGNPVSDDCQAMYPQVIVYNRVPKAGSTTMLELIRQMVKRNNFRLVIPEQKHDPDLARSLIQKALLSGENTLIAHHFHFPDYIHSKIAYINVIRNPVDRCISAYYYARFGPRGVGEDRDNKIAKTMKRYGNLTLEECLERPYEKIQSCFNCPSQGMTRFFCGPDHGICDHPQPEEMLRRSWHNIESQYFVGVVEDMRESMVALELLYPEFFTGIVDAMMQTPPQRVNEAATEEKKQPTEEMRTKIATWSAVDTEMYRRSRERLHRIYASCLVNREGEIPGHDSEVAADSSSSS